VGLFQRGWITADAVKKNEFLGLADSVYRFLNFMLPTHLREKDHGFTGFCYVFNQKKIGQFKGGDFISWCI
jgi:hypothetical protein